MTEKTLEECLDQLRVFANQIEEEGDDHDGMATSMFKIIRFVERELGIYPVVQQRKAG